jgi:hypothetical protein
MPTSAPAGAQPVAPSGAQSAATPQPTRQPAKQGQPAAVSKKAGSEEDRPRAKPVQRYKVSMTTLCV